MKVRKATLRDLPYLIQFATEEAREAEGISKTFDTTGGYKVCIYCLIKEGRNGWRC